MNHTLARSYTARVELDPRMGPKGAREGFAYALDTGKEGAVRVDQVLECNQDPSYLRDLLVYS